MQPNDLAISNYECFRSSNLGLKYFMALLSKNRLFQVLYLGVEALFQPDLADLSNISDDGLFVG